MGAVRATAGLSGCVPNRRPSSSCRSFGSSVTATTSRPRAARAAASVAAAAAGPPAARPAPEGFSYDAPSALASRIARPCGGQPSFVLLIAAACLSGGCVLNGDFGRIRPELVGDNMHDWVGRDAAVAVGGPISEFRTTDQERDLRDRAYALIEPPYNRGRWDSVLREYGLSRDPAQAAAVRPHRISLQAAQGLSPLRGVGLCADRHRRAQRRRADAAVLCRRHPRDRHGPAAQGEPRARIEPQPARTRQRHRPQQARTPRSSPGYASR